MLPKSRFSTRPVLIIPALISLASLIGITIPAKSAHGEEISGLEIMTQVDQREDGDDQVSRAVFELINKRGQKRVRDTIRLWKDYEGKESFDTKMITFFESPPDVKGTGFLSWSYWDEDKDDDQWLYLPALRKVRRIAAGNKGDYFMGTDFTYDDMGERKVEEDRHTLVRSEIYNNADCYVVESVSKNKGYIYSKKLSWVNKKQWIPLKVDYYDRKDKLLKTLQMDWQLISDIWTWKKAEMANHQTGHRTTIEISEIAINVGLEDGDFMERGLKRGYRKQTHDPQLH